MKQTILIKGLVSIVFLFLSSQSYSSIQTVYSCSLSDGVSFEQLMALEKTYVSELKKLKGADKFTASVSTPIAAQAEQGRDFIWVGVVPDLKSYAQMSAAYETSKSAQKSGAAFMDIARCNSSSIWKSTPIN